MSENGRRNYTFGTLCSVLGYLPDLSGSGKAGSVRSIDGLMPTFTPSFNDLVYGNHNDRFLVLLLFYSRASTYDQIVQP